MKKKISLSEIVATLEDKGLHKTAENVKKVVEEKTVGQPDAEESAAMAIESIDRLIRELTADGTALDEERPEIEMALDDIGDKRLLKQYYRADKFIDQAAKEYRRLRQMIGKLT